jgi:hypothetical protein
MLRPVALVRIEVSEERTASIIRLTRVGVLGTTSSRHPLPRNNSTYIVHFRGWSRLLISANDAPSLQILVILMIEARRSSKTSVLSRATRRNIPEDGILHLSHRIPVQNSLMQDVLSPLLLKLCFRISH